MLYNLYVEDKPEDEQMFFTISGLRSAIEKDGEETAARSVLELIGDFEQTAFAIGLHAGRKFCRDLEPKFTDTYFRTLHTYVFSDPPLTNCTGVCTVCPFERWTK